MTISLPRVTAPAVTYWRCQVCRHILGTVIEGRCEIMHKVTLSNSAPVVVCPVCGMEVKWYAYKVREG